MGNIAAFFIIFLAALLFSQLSSRFRVPWVVALIIAGIVIGPFGLEIVQIDETVGFLGDLGLVFLMFMAGIETKFSTFKEFRREITLFSIGSGLLPFFAGIILAYFLGLSLQVAFMLGIIFISSSIAVVIPTMEASGYTRLKVGKTAVAGAIINDIASLMLLSILLQTQDNLTSVPLPIFYILLIASLGVLRWAIPKVKKSFSRKRDLFEHEMHVIFTILVGTVVFFELLGLHQITAGFFAGLVLSDSINSIKVKEKLHAIAYGVFIPVFFVVVGARTDISLLFNLDRTLPLTIAIVSTSIISKIFGGFMGGLAAKFTRRESLLLGFSGIPQLSTTLAVVFAGNQLGILSDPMLVAMVILSIVTTFVAPLLIRGVRLS